VTLADGAHLAPVLRAAAVELRRAAQMLDQAADWAAKGGHS